MLETQNTFLQVEPNSINVIVGKELTQQITLTNLSTENAVFKLEVQNLPKKWFKISPDTLKLPANGNQKIAFKVKVRGKAKAGRHSFQLVAVLHGKSNTKIAIPLTLTVVAPLRLDAKIKLESLTNNEAIYSLILVNRDSNDNLVNLELDNSKAYLQGLDTPDQLRLLAGQSQTVGFRVRLENDYSPNKIIPAEREKSAKRQKIGQLDTLKPKLQLANFKRPDRVVVNLIKRHPWLSGLCGVLVLLVLFWSLLILPAIQGSLISSVDRAQFGGSVLNSIRVEQWTFNDTLTIFNPFGALIRFQTNFVEADQTVEIIAQSFLVNSTLKGQLTIDAKRDLVFKPANPYQLNTLPWLLAPPNRIVARINSNLQRWLKMQTPPQQLDHLEIEGNTLFIYPKPCTTTGIACN